MNLEKMSAIELKAMAYDLSIQMARAQQQIQMLNEEIGKREFETKDVPSDLPSNA